MKPQNLITSNNELQSVQENKPLVKKDNKVTPKEHLNKTKTILNTQIASNQTMIDRLQEEVDRLKAINKDLKEEKRQYDIAIIAVENTEN